MKNSMPLVLGLAAVMTTGCGSEPLKRVDAFSHSPAPLELSESNARQALAAAAACGSSNFRFSPSPWISARAC